MDQDARILELTAQLAEAANGQVAREQLGAGFGGAVRADRPPAPIDKKIIEKPTKYNGDTGKFPEFQDGLKEYLDLHDERWKPILEGIEASTQPLGMQEVIDITRHAGASEYQVEFMKQLFNYLKAFAGGEANRMIIAGGRDGVYESYRLMAEQGRSRRPEHVMVLRNKVNNPVKPAGLAGLVSAITDWEKDLAYLMRIKAEYHMDAEDKRLILINMCPKELQDYFLR